MSRTQTVALIYGGPSSEHDVSLQSAASVRKAFEELDHRTTEIYIDRGGNWHREGTSKPVDRILAGIDFVFNAMHGQYGEDGQVQAILERHHMPYNGADSYGSKIAFEKQLTKRHYQFANLKTPESLFFRSHDDIARHFPHGSYQDFEHELVIKPVAGGSSVGVTMVRDYHSVKQKISETLAQHGNVLLERRIRGREATVGVVHGLFGEDFFALPVVEIIPQNEENFFHYDAKYDGSTKEVVPGNFEKGIAHYLQEAAIAAHKALGLRHYSRSDFIISDDGEVYILETNTLPGLTTKSLFPKELEAHGISLSKFFNELIKNP